MSSIACTLVLKSDPSQKANLNVVRDDDGSQTWSRWGSDVGGLQLYDNHGTWEYDSPTGLLTLWFAQPESDGSGRGISLQKVPSDFFRAVTCGRSASGSAYESHNRQDLLYTLWFGCV
jgi:hypothetical protein